MVPQLYRLVRCLHLLWLALGQVALPCLRAPQGTTTPSTNCLEGAEHDRGGHTSLSHGLSEVIEASCMSIEALRQAFFDAARADFIHVLASRSTPRILTALVFD